VSGIEGHKFILRVIAEVRALHHIEPTLQWNYCSAVEIQGLRIYLPAIHGQFAVFIGIAKANRGTPVVIVFPFDLAKGGNSLILRRQGSCSCIEIEEIVSRRVKGAEKIDMSGSFLMSLPSRVFPPGAPQ